MMKVKSVFSIKSFWESVCSHIYKILKILLNSSHQLERLSIKTDLEHKRCAVGHENDDFSNTYFFGFCLENHLEFGTVNT